MSVNLNVMLFGGRLTRDPEVRHTQGGMAVCKFGMASNRKRGDNEEVCFVDVTAFGKTAEIVERFVKKGDPLIVRGRLQLETWEAKDGSGKRSKHSIVAEEITLCGSKSDGDGAPRGAQRRGDVSGRREYRESDFEAPADANDAFGEIPF
jgi:single-strand DNA-binding protein